MNVRQGCLLSPTFFSIILDRIVAGVLAGREWTVGIGYAAIVNVPVVYGFAAIVTKKKEKELMGLTEQVDKNNNNNNNKKTKTKKKNNI